MNDYPDDLNVLRQDNEELKKRNVELEGQLEIIKKATEELEKYREGAAIDKLATEARNKVLAGFGILGIASIVGVVGIYFTLLNTLEKKILEKETFNQIVSKVETAVQAENRLNKITEQIKQTVSSNLGEKFKNDKDFRDQAVNTVAEKLLRDKEFTAIFTANVNYAIDIAVGKLVTELKNNPDKDIIDAFNQTVESKRYFVVAASSEEENDLRNINLVNKVTNINVDRDVYICKPKSGNNRSVLIIARKSVKSMKLPLASAQFIQKEIKAIPDFETAYILPTVVDDNITMADNNIFFDIKKCEILKDK